MDINYYEVLGLETPAASEGANEQEVAEPANEGANEQEVAEPAEAETETEVTETEVEEEAAPAADNQPTTVKEQSKEERAANARRRREAENAEAIRKAVEAEQARLREEYNKAIAAAGLANPFDGKKPINSIEELAEYNRTRSQKQMEKDLRDGKLTPEAFQSAVENSEPFKRLQAQMQQETTAKEQVDSERRELAIKAQMEEISKIDPTIKAPKDFLNMPDYDKFKSYVDRGFTFVEALQMTRFSDIINTAAAKASQASINNAASKNHLQSSKSKGKGAISVPSEVVEMYRVLNPNATDAEIQAHYNKNRQ